MNEEYEEKSVFDELLEEFENNYVMQLDTYTDALGRGSTNDLINYIRGKITSYEEVIKITKRYKEK